MSVVNSSVDREIQSPYRVMLVDDSAVVRGLIRRSLEVDPEIEIVGAVGDGLAAVERIRKGDVEIVVLDIEMPRMDGLTALREMLKIEPGLQVIMASTLTQRNADISLRAIGMGARDYVAKPSTSREIVGAETFQMELLARIKGFGAQSRRRPQFAGGTRTARRPAATGAPPFSPRRKSPLTNAPRAIAIGSSTGGPAALFSVLSGFPHDPDLPLFITQHMPATFTGMLAKHISDKTNWPCKEATDGEIPRGGQAYLAPGDYHMTINAGPVIRLTQEPPVNFCRPSVDPMLESLVTLYQNRLLAVILTGMGHDGAAGCKLARDAGGDVIVQDQASSVVWGMPGAVANAGVARAILPLESIGIELGRVSRL
jgi:two-component system, chemotaxis family, protein-glutamate methylesterase/glutaminase